MKKTILNKFKDSQSPSPQAPQRPYFKILKQIRKNYKRFNAFGTQTFVQMNQIEDGTADPVGYLKSAFEHLLVHVKKDIDATDMVGITIKNTESIMDKDIGISLRRSSELNIDVVWSVISKVIQSNA